MLFVSYVGFGMVVDSVVVVLMISGVFGIPTAWIPLRTWVLGPPHAIADFVRYFERKGDRQRERVQARHFPECRDVHCRANSSGSCRYDFC